MEFQLLIPKIKYLFDRVQHEIDIKPFRNIIVD